MTRRIAHRTTPLAALLLAAACSTTTSSTPTGAQTTTATASPHPTVVIAPPAGTTAPGELTSPEAAAVAWFSRWCGFDYRSPVGTRESLARPTMTERAWFAFDPLTSPAQASLWSVITAERSTGACSAPVAVVSPEAPRSSTAAYVIVTAERVVTPAAGPPRVEQVRETRQVLLRDGRWLVDLAANGAG